MIYGLCEPGTNLVRYVGKTINLAERLRTHSMELRNKRLKTRKVNWLRSLDGTAPEVVVLEESSFDNWEDAERRWISDLRQHGYDLTNFAEGGQTSPTEGKHHTEETKEKLRRRHLEIGSRPPDQKGYKHSSECKQKLRETHLRIGTIPPPSGGWNKGIRRTHCKNGHEYKPETTRLYHRSDRNVTYQICRICEQARNARCLSKKRNIV